MIDIGLNLASSQFDKDRKEMISRALSAGLTGFILTGTSLSSSEEVLKLCEESPEIMRCTSGVHPHDAKSWYNARQTIAKLAQSDMVVAIGECGLDYDRMFSSVEEQKLAFKEQLEIALKFNKPVFLHVRGKNGEEKQVMKDFMEVYMPYHEKGVKGVVHCFTGSGRMLNTLSRLGLYIGITGWVCDDKRGKELQSIIKYISNDKLMIETDAPYLTPKNMPKELYQRKNEPAFLSYVLEKVAELKKVSKDDLIKLTNDNVENLFGVKF